MYIKLETERVLRTHLELRVSRKPPHPMTQPTHPDRSPERLRLDVPVLAFELYFMSFHYVPLVFALFLGPGAFLPRPEDRRQPPFLDQLYTSNGGCSTSMCHRVVADTVVQRISGWGRLARGAPRPVGGARGRRHLTREPCHARVLRSFAATTPALCSPERPRSFA